MIVVIADDITGAAELGGVALRYGLRALLSNEVKPAAGTDVLIIYTNTRSLQRQEAVAVMTDVTQKAKALNPSFFYKKTDSVLRGHVLAEMEAQMQVFRFEKALLVPANPLLGRTIKQGKYFLHGQPIHETEFSADPEFPLGSSNVVDLLGKGTVPVHLLKHGDELRPGIAIGEAVKVKDVEGWTKFQDEPVLLAGAASFFNALLAARFQPVKNHPEFKLATPMLLVSGTTYQKSVDRRNDLQHLVSYMPSSLFKKNIIDPKNIEKWAGQILGILSIYSNAVVAIGDHGEITKKTRLLKEKLGAVVKSVTDQAEIKELLIEGGATAFGIIQELGLSSFIPTEELSQGVVRMKSATEEWLHLTIKPGSYEWPRQWHFT